MEEPAAVADYLRSCLAGRPHEIFLVLFMDVKMRLIATEELFRGTVSQTKVYPREVVKAALRHNASSVILAHNHPSGIAQPSEADRAAHRISVQGAGAGGGAGGRSRHRGRARRLFLFRARPIVKFIESCETQLFFTSD